MLIFCINCSNIVAIILTHSLCLSCHLCIMPSVSLELALLQDPEILIERE